MLGNIGTLPNERTGEGQMKLDKWKHLATQECDLNILMEHNKYMDLLPEQETLEYLTGGWWNGTMCHLAFLRAPNRELRTLDNQEWLQSLRTENVHVSNRRGDQIRANENRGDSHLR